MKLYFFIFGIVSTLKISCQNSNSFFSRFGSNADDLGYSIVQAKDSGYFTLSVTNGFGASQTDILLSKLDSNGIPVWHKLFGGFNNDIGTSMKELPDKSIVFVGYSNSIGSGGYDGVIYKVDKNGNLIWVKTYGGLDWDFAYSVNICSDGNLIICGTTYSFGRGDKDGFLLKMDLNGNTIWSKVYGALKEDYLKRIIQTSDGGFIAVGSTKSYGDSLGNVWITKFDQFGDSVWFKQFGHNLRDWGNAIVVDVFGDYVFTGASQDTINGKLNAYIVRFNTSGNIVWERFYDFNSNDEESYDIVTSNSNYGNYVITFGSKDNPGFGSDVKTLLLDGFGYYLKGGTFGSVKDDICFSLSNSYDKGYIACGFTENYNAQSKDVFIVKYDSVMTIGPLSVSVPENLIQRRITVMPTLVHDKMIHIQKDEKDKIFVELYTIYGEKLDPFQIQETDKEIIIKVSEETQGIVIVCLNNGLVIKKCIID